MTADRPDAADYGDAFLDVAREWETSGQDVARGWNAMNAQTAEEFADAVAARAAKYAERPAAESRTCDRCGEPGNGKHYGLCCDCAEIVEREVHHHDAAPADGILDAAWALFNAVLDRPFADPDDDSAKAARALAAKLGKGEG